MPGKSEFVRNNYSNDDADLILSADDAYYKDNKVALITRILNDLKNRGLYTKDEAEDLVVLLFPDE
jgi:hypothetical protein